jgi:hypothetical protein
MRWHRLVFITVIITVGITAASLAQERFDNQVRDDMFRAFGGNEAAFKNALSIIEEKLRENPDHAEALVWRGLPATGRPARRSLLATVPAPKPWRPPRWSTWTVRSPWSQATSEF